MARNAGEAELARIAVGYRLVLAEPAVTAL
jgi:hypothetical protein